MSVVSADPLWFTASAGVERPADSALLEISDLRTEFTTRQGHTKAIDGMDLTIGHGEVVALVGESGSGKSATALSVLRLLPPEGRITSGSVWLDGVDLLSLPESKMNHVRGSRIAMLFQQPKATLDPTCRIGDQVAESLRMHCGLSKRAAWDKALELLADVGIPEPARRAQSNPHQKSGGMAQRVMIAVALSGAPDLLIADEPTTALDATVQAQILQLLLRKRAEADLSILLITHDLSIVRTFADRVAVMYAGQIVEQGPVKELFDDPRHPYTQALVKSSLLVPDAAGRLFTITGSRSGLDDGIVGCRYRARCPLTHELGIEKTCASADPHLATCGCGPLHLASCWGTKNGAGKQ